MLGSEKGEAFDHNLPPNTDHKTSYSAEVREIFAMLIIHQSGYPAAATLQVSPVLILI